jgi:hypothetical protein
MISIAILIAAVLLPAIFSKEILYAIAAFAASSIIVMALNPLPTLSESMIVVAAIITAYAGAVYLTKRAVVYLSKNKFGKY